MSAPGCDRSALVEAMFDGRLGPAEQASTERHLKGCASCSEALRELTSLQQSLRSTERPLSPLEHQRARLALLRTAASPPSRARRPVGLLAAAAVMLPFAVWAASSTLSPFRLARPAASPPPAVLSAPPGPSAGHTPGGPGPRLVPAEPVPEEPVPAVSTGVSSDTAPPAPSVGPAATADTAPSSSPPPPPPPPREAHAPSPPGPSSAALPPRREASERPAGAAASAKAQGASGEFADAMRSLSQGDFGASAGKLEGFARAHPGDPRVEEAAYLSAIALERAGRLAEARAAARRYLTAYPDGAHRAQARRIAGE